jgi:hypothetical protein
METLPPESGSPHGRMIADWRNDLSPQSEGAKTLHKQTILQSVVGEFHHG